MALPMSFFFTKRCVTNSWAITKKERKKSLRVLAADAKNKIMGPSGPPLCTKVLRILTECYILVETAMLGTTFNLVTGVGLYLWNTKIRDSSLKIYDLPFNNCFPFRTLFSFLKKNVHFELYDLLQISPVHGPNTYEIMYEET